MLLRNRDSNNSHIYICSSLHNSDHRTQDHCVSHATQSVMHSCSDQELEIYSFSGNLEQYERGQKRHLTEVIWQMT